MKITKIGSTLLLCAVVLVSCHKTVTKRKLDGDWTVSKSTNTFTSGGYTSTSTNDGTTTTVAYTGGIDTYSEATSFSFDKKAGTFETVTTQNQTNVGNVGYYEKVLSSYVLVGSYSQTDAAISTSTTKGTFTITGGTGDIEKNTQIVLISTSLSDITNHTYSYKQGGVAVTDFAGKYIQSYVGGSMTYVAMASTGTENTTNSGTNLDQQVLTVSSLKKGVMEVEMNYSSTGANTQSSDTKMTLTEKK